MTKPLSPAAQTVLDQAIYKGPKLEKRVAAALRVAADQLGYWLDGSDYYVISKDELLAIAAELENC